MRARIPPSGRPGFRKAPRNTKRNSVIFKVLMLGPDPPPTRSLLFHPLPSSAPLFPSGLSLSRPEKRRERARKINKERRGRGRRAERKTCGKEARDTSSAIIRTKCTGARHAARAAAPRAIRISFDFPLECEPRAQCHFR